MELYRKELKLAVIKGLDESRGSSNVPIKLTHDTSDEYINYTEQIHIRYLFDNQLKEEILPTNDNCFYIPGKPLSHDGPIELAVHLINGDIELVTNELSFVVKNAPNGTTQVDPSEFTWQQLVDQYVNAKLDTFANKLDLSKFEETVNGSIENQNQNIESFKTEVNANLSNQDKKITDLQNTTKVSLDSQNTKIDNFKSEVNTSLSNQNTSINQTTSAQNSKITTLESRMDTFTRLSEGSTTGDAELKDIRVGANGVTYNNAGDAVRGQYSQLKEDLSYLKNNELIGLLKNEYVEINSNTVYVPFSLKAGEVVTISTIDGTNFSENNVYVDFYSDTNTLIDFYGVNKTFGNSRTFTWNKANVAKIKCRDNTNNRVFRVSKPNTTKKLNFESSGLNINDSNFDLNDCKPNLIYTISTMCYNAPSVGTCFTFARNGGAIDTYVQFFVSIKNDLYTRYKRYGSGWTEWEEYAKANYNYSAKLSIFDKIGVVGDSYASGEMYKPDGTLIGDNYKISWLQQLARRNGFTGFNFSTGGLSTRTWLTSEHGLVKLNSSDICDLYILALGINDYYALGETYLGTENDITTKTDTFYGNYAKIIEAIQTKSSPSKLIMMDIAIKNNESSATKALIKKFNEAIVTIANHYNIPVAYQNKNRYFELDLYRDSMYHGHPSIVGYSAMATQLEHTISECMFANQSYFES